MNTVAFPTFFSSLISNCFYCGANNNGGNFIIRSGKGILACQNHKDAAKRDGRAWLHKAGLVLIDDVNDEPLFKALPKKQMIVRRSNGSLEYDWRVPTSDNDLGKLMNLLFLAKNEWHITLINSNYGIKDVPIEELTLSLSSGYHLLVYDFIEKLNAGIYLKEEIEHDKIVKEPYEEESDEMPTSPITVLEFLKGAEGPLI